MTDATTIPEEIQTVITELQSCNPKIGHIIISYDLETDKFNNMLTTNLNRLQTERLLCLGITNNFTALAQATAEAKEKADAEAALNSTASSDAVIDITPEVVVESEVQTD